MEIAGFGQNQQFGLGANTLMSSQKILLIYGGLLLGEAVDSNYEADLEARGVTMFYSSQNWAFSSTKNFMDDAVESDKYIMANTSALRNITGPVSELYKTARASPLSHVL
ncbi:hypothetical protein C2S53_001329 [Perilla frutescens var. hirtella]|uniref:Uncharacterized protein n=1 Tax=Perilla frutescens var. hirtella TaxID=608512 RepID=A0AAD4IVY5_PERFH|nr:hypothetical protein C2S53_001329 [Perilla frutescens var. hirtella]